MKFSVEKIGGNAASLMRRAGYVFQYERDGEMSFVRSFTRSGFPRFHSYTRTENLSLIVSIHLDQKRETYGRDTRHHGEYEDEGALKEEVERLKSVFGNMTLLA